MELKSYEDQIYDGIVKEDDVCFDIGANTGSVTLFLAEKVGVKGIVVAFEPVFDSYCKLNDNIQKNKNIKGLILPLQLGLSDTVKSIDINIPDNEYMMASIADKNKWEAAQKVKVVSQQIQVTTLDYFLESTLIASSDFIKIDVEGAELLVIKGASKWFEGEAHPIMLIEVFAPWEKAFDYKPWELFSILISYGYKFLFACPRGLITYIPTETEAFPIEYQKGYNVIAYLPEIHSDRIGNIQSLFAVNNPTILDMFPASQLNIIS